MLFRKSLVLSLALVLVGNAIVTTSTLAQAQAGGQKYEQMIDKAIAFLGTKAQGSDGAFNSQAGPAITALVTTGVLRHGRSPDDPMVAKALAYLEGFVHPDGGIHAPETFYKNYETCLAIMCFKEANRGGKYDAILRNADAFIKANQWGSAGEKGPGDVEFGGAGYGRSKRPDLSNTSFFVDALKAAGNDENSDAIQRALLFVSRCQNYENPANTTQFAGKINDGGFYYTPAAGGSSQAGVDDATGGLRSYASMTYAGLKSMIYAGLKPEDPRVQAALRWLRKNYDLDSNPGMGSAGQYYYYHTFAKALAALGEDQFVDDKGVAHNWRQELIDELASRQKEDGSWVNENSKWMEGDASLVTGYALLALSYCKK